MSVFDGANYEGLRRWICPHTVTTPEDGKGRAICAACGSVAVVRLTEEIFNQQWKSWFRHG